MKTLIGFLLLVTTTGLAQNRVDTYNGRGQNLTIYGVVVDSLRAPVAGAYLWFALEGPRVQTDTVGRFFLRFNRQFDYALPDKISGYVLLGKRIFPVQLRHRGESDQFIILPIQHSSP